MPELPDVELYLSALTPRIVGRTLEGVRLATPFLLRSVEPPIEDAIGQRVSALRRLGKRIIWQFEDDRKLLSRQTPPAFAPRVGAPSAPRSACDPLFFVFHLMIAGRFRWRPQGGSVPRHVGLAAFDFPDATLLLTESATKKRASLHVVRGEAALAHHDAGGLEIMTADPETFARVLQRENHTLKRALTDPRLFSGIGNAYSDEILHRARLSPFKLTRQLTPDEVGALYAATRETLAEWTERLQQEAGANFPEKVTAFREGMAVHGRFGKPCPRCGTPVQRIVHGENEVNYCPICQTEGRLLADRALSKLLKGDWPRTLDELERRRHKQKGRGKREEGREPSF